MSCLPITYVFTEFTPKIKLPEHFLIIFTKSTISKCYRVEVLTITHLYTVKLRHYHCREAKLAREHHDYTTHTPRCHVLINH